VTEPEQNPASERARYYRERAAEFLQKAQDATSDDMKATYLGMAAHWRDLAVAAERAPDPLPDAESKPRIA
jgi:hypothetical protein